jgi:hypothetical protein
MMNLGRVVQSSHYAMVLTSCEGGSIDCLRL